MKLPWLNQAPASTDAMMLLEDNEPNDKVCSLPSDLMLVLFPHMVTKLTLETVIKNPRQFFPAVVIFFCQVGERLGMMIPFWGGGLLSSLQQFNFQTSHLPSFRWTRSGYFSGPRSITYQLKSSSMKASG